MSEGERVGSGFRAVRKSSPQEGHEDNDQDLMKAFYRSGASNFAAFKRARAGQMSAGPSTAPSGSLADIVQPAAPSPNNNGPPSPAASAPAAPSPTAQPLSPTSGAKAPKEAAPVPPSPKADPTPAPAAAPAAAPSAPTAPAQNPSPAPVPKQASKPAAGQAPPPEKENGAAASVNYLQFLREQQQLQKCHQRLEEIVEQMKRERQECQANVTKTRRSAAEILQSLEAGTNWNLNSKYSVQSLIRDAKLKLQPRELYQPSAQPQYLDIVQQQGNLQKLMKDHPSRPAYEDFSRLFENATKRLERVEKEVRGSQLDATPIATLPDTLFIQLDHVLGSPAIHEVLDDNGNQTEDLIFKLQDTQLKLKNCLVDGEMQLAEEYYSDVVSYFEAILELVRDKIETTKKTKSEAQVFDRVREQYQSKAKEQAEKLNRAKEQLKKRCEDDLQHVFQLKEKVDQIEESTVKKLAEDMKKSNSVLDENNKQMEGVWSKIQLLEANIIELEKDRATEVKRRVAAKEKDEHRRMEYEQFCQIVEQHCGLLDLTIRNCDTALHVITMLDEMVDTGFSTLGTHLSQQDVQYSELLLEGHISHLEHFRGLYLVLGELIMKKEQKIAQTDDSIRNAHVQQKLKEETFNPDAKRYSTAKKELLDVRDRTEKELRELRGKADYALEAFRLSEEALTAAGVTFVHPVIEQQQCEVELKTKLAEFKMIAMGQTDSVPIQQDLGELKRGLMENSKAILSIRK